MVLSLFEDGGKDLKATGVYPVGLGLEADRPKGKFLVSGGFPLDWLV